MFSSGRKFQYFVIVAAFCGFGCGDDGGGDDGGSATSDSETGGTGASDGTETSEGSTTGDETATDSDTGTAGNATSGTNTSGAGTGGTGGTGSSGGDPGEGIPCGTPIEVRDLTGCETVVEGNRVRFMPPPEGHPVNNIGVYLHGDSTNPRGGDFPGGNRVFDQTILPWAQERDIVLVAIESPTGYSGPSGSPAFGAAQPEDADLIAPTIERFIDAYNADPDRTYFWGASGGSWFISSSFVARAGHRLPGIYVPNCGGSQSTYGWAWDPETDTETRDKIAIYWNYGSEDFLAPGSADSEARFAAQGFTVDSLVHPGAGHCAQEIDIPGNTLDFWMRHTQ